MSIKPATKDETAALALAERSGWPPELRALIERYPRELWRGHKNLGQMAQFWISRHNMLRELAASITQGTADFQAGKLTAEQFPPWLVPRLQFFLEQLHAHHHIEDHHYFPIFRRADQRLARGFDVLELDHGELHRNIDLTVEAANAFLRSISDAETVKRTGDAFAQSSGTLMKGLTRHLDDEEDLIVPLILDRGEEELGVAHG
jgi:iron-sulfur cluster repair protein YtfE (RIC family)